MEALEGRLVLNGYTPTGLEQEFLERLNDARANPAAYFQSVGLDPSTAPAPSQPLAFNTALIQSSRDHSTDMSVNNYFGHTGSDGSSPFQRMSNDGFPWVGAAESIAGGQSSVETALQALIVDSGVSDLGHRKQLLSFGGSPYTSEQQTGVGIVMNGSGSLHNYYTIDSGNTSNTAPFLTGAIYQDANHNGLYDNGEGLGGVTISVTGSNGSYQTTTWSSGGYSLQVKSGTYTVTASGGSLATQISQTITVGSTNYRLNFTPSASGQSGFSDPGFESPTVGTGASAYKYDPTSGTPWTFSGLAGVAGNSSGFTSGNPSAPQGTQAAFLQGTGSVSQAVTFAAGNYTISFSAAQRQNYQASRQTIQVTVDGNVVGTITPSGTSYASYTTNTFTVTAGSHTIAFVGLNPNGGDNTAFLDQAGINKSTPAFSDPGFENLSVGTGSSAYKYNPISGTPWTFSSSSGVAGNNSAFTSGNPSAPQGTQVAFLQFTGSISQTVNFAAGTYTISFSAAQRQNYQASKQVIEVTVDGNVVGTITPSGTSYATYTTGSFTVTAGSHTIAFIGLNPNGGDNTAFLDQITIQ
jgi:uncharacterized protein YkwD